MTAVTPGREEPTAVLIVAAGAIIDVMMGGKFDWRYRINDSDFLESADWQMAVLYASAALAAKPADEGVRIPYDGKVKLGYVWLVWGVTADGRVDLVAIATTEEARDRYLEAGRQMGQYRAVKDEQAYVDHLFGGGLLKAITNSRRALSTPGAPKP